MFTILHTTHVQRLNSAELWPVQEKTCELDLGRVNSVLISFFKIAKTISTRVSNAVKRFQLAGKCDVRQEFTRMCETTFFSFSEPIDLRPP
jgi:hypothetical protein